MSRKHKTENLSFWQELLDKYESPQNGLSQRELAKQYNVSLNTLKNRFYELRKQRRKQQRSSPGERKPFVEVVMAQVSQKTTPTPSKAAPLCVLLPTGEKVEFTSELSPSYFSSILSALRGESC